MLMARCWHLKPPYHQPLSVGLGKCAEGNLRHGLQGRTSKLLDLKRPAHTPALQSIEGSEEVMELLKLLGKCQSGNLLIRKSLRWLVDIQFSPIKRTFEFSISSSARRSLLTADWFHTWDTMG